MLLSRIRNCVADGNELPNLRASQYRRVVPCDKKVGICCLSLLPKDVWGIHRGLGRILHHCRMTYPCPKERFPSVCCPEYYRCSKIYCCRHCRMLWLFQGANSSRPWLDGRNILQYGRRILHRCFGKQNLSRRKAASSQSALLHSQGIWFHNLPRLLLCCSCRIVARHFRKCGLFCHNP